jgi:hypothetical protein
MPSLIFRCPNTGNEVDSGIQIGDPRSPLIRTSSFRTRCPFCGEIHEWPITTRPPDPQAPTA